LDRGEVVGLQPGLDLVPIHVREEVVRGVHGPAPDRSERRVLRWPDHRPDAQRGHDGFLLCGGHPIHAVSTSPPSAAARSAEITSAMAQAPGSMTPFALSPT